MLRKTFTVLLIFFLVLGFIGCSSESSTGINENIMPDNETGADYTQAVDDFDTAAVNNNFDQNQSSLYNELFGNWLSFPGIFFGIYEEIKNTATYNRSENRWEALIENPFGNDPADITIYGEYTDDNAFWIHSADDPQGTGMYIYPDGGITIYLEVDNSQYVKAEIYKGDDGYYYGFLRFNDVEAEPDQPLILKFKFENQSPCEDFRLYLGKYNGSSTVGDYVYIRDRQVDPDTWYTDSSLITRYFTITWDGTNFNFTPMVV